MVTKKEKYLKLDDTQWSLSAYKLRLEERIAYGSYGDVFCGILLTPMTFKGNKEDEKMVEKQIVAKVLNGARWIFLFLVLVKAFVCINSCLFRCLFEREDDGVCK